MVDDDLNMVALPETRNIKSIVTAEDRLCIERKNKQAVQGLLYVRFICFGNGNLVAAHDDSDGFWRRQILITVKDRDPARGDNPFLIEELSEERPGILLWMLEEMCIRDRPTTATYSPFGTEKLTSCSAWTSVSPRP